MGAHLRMKYRAIYQKIKSVTCTSGHPFLPKNALSDFAVQQKHRSVQHFYRVPQHFVAERLHTHLLCFSNKAKDKKSRKIVIAKTPKTMTFEKQIETNDKAIYGDKILSSREIEVLQLAAEGLSNKQIGDNLNISEDTIDTHNRSIVAKLGARNMKQAIAMGIRGKIIK